MEHIIAAAFSWSAVFLIVGRRSEGLWKAGLLGAGLVALVDWLGTAQNLYVYPDSFINVGKLPLFHIINSYAVAILFLNWLPSCWKKRVYYTVCAAVVILVKEAVMLRAGAIAYHAWELWYSFFLLVSGLFPVVFFADMLGLIKTENRN